jgi:acetyl esterase/lipase
MALDPQVKTVLDQLASLGGPPLHELGVAQARALLDGFAAVGGPPTEVARVEDRTFAGPAGDVPVRIYRPTDDATPQPALVWFHGGGWVLGSIEGSDLTCRDLAAHAGVVVVSVGYRLAPEHPYPAGVDDCYAALVWVSATAGDLGVDPTRIAVGGESAGGNLAAVVALAARDRGAPAVRFQLLVYPVIDALLSHPSIRDNGQGYMLTDDAMKWFVELYLGERGDPKDPLVSPLYADDLSGLPPALVITAEFDPLRDEGEAYCARLQQGRVAAKVSRYDGMIHGFFSMGAIVEAARPATVEAADALRSALA